MSLNLVELQIKVGIRELIGDCRQHRVILSIYF